MAEVDETAAAVGQADVVEKVAMSAEEKQRLERRQKAEAELAQFHEQRQREIEERQQRNREREQAKSQPSTEGYSAAPPPGGLDISQLLNAHQGSSSSSSISQLLQSPAVANMLQNPANASSISQLLQNPANAAMLQQVAPGLMAHLDGAAAATPAASSSAASGSSEPQVLAVRVREAESERATFRRVVLAEASPEGQSRAAPSFEEVERRICGKFKSSRNSDGTEAGLRRLVALVRLRDSLEVADDEDASLLVDGDELEATFTAL